MAQSNLKFNIKETISSSAVAWDTFKISNDFELNEVIETTQTESIVLKNAVQLERMEITATGWIATIIRRWLTQWANAIEDVDLKKQWNDWDIGYITQLAFDIFDKQEDNIIPDWKKIKFWANSYIWTENDGDDLKFKDTNNAERTLTDLSTSWSNDKARISANDTTAWYLNGKLVAWDWIELEEQNDWWDETLKITWLYPIFWDWSDWDLVIVNWETVNLDLNTIYQYNSINIQTWWVLSTTDIEWIMKIKCKWTCNIDWIINLNWKIVWDTEDISNIIYSADVLAWSDWVWWVGWKGWDDVSDWWVGWTTTVKRWGWWGWWGWDSSSDDWTAWENWEDWGLWWVWTWSYPWWNGWDGWEWWKGWASLMLYVKFITWAWNINSNWSDWIAWENWSYMANRWWGWWGGAWAAAWWWAILIIFFNNSFSWVISQISWSDWVWWTWWWEYLWDNWWSAVWWATSWNNLKLNINDLF